MRFAVQTAIELSEIRSELDEEVLNCALRPGFQFIVNENTGEIIEPVLLYFRFPSAVGSRWRPNTRKARSEDLVDWWRYLSIHGLVWNEVGRDEAIHYRDAMRFTISPYTHEPYSDRTVIRRLDTILGFYEWAEGQGYYKGKLDKKEIRQIPARIDDNPRLAMSGSLCFAHARTTLRQVVCGIRELPGVPPCTTGFVFPLRCGQSAATTKRNHQSTTRAACRKMAGKVGVDTGAVSLYWLPQFSLKVFDAAKQHHLSDLPPLE